MKYLFLTFVYLLGSTVFIMLNFYDNGWQFLQPFLILVLLVYFNTENPWIYYTFASLAGLLLDSLSGVFGLHALIFIFIIFVLRSLQLTIITARNILTIISLTVFAFFLFWLIFWLSNIFFGWQLYHFNFVLWQTIVQKGLINIFIVIILHLLFYNFWIRGHANQQSF